MNKKKIYLIALICVILTIVVHFVYRAIKEKTILEKTDLYSLVSKDAVLVLESKDIVSFSKSVLYENSYWEMMDSLSFLSSFTDCMKKIDLLSSKTNFKKEHFSSPFLLVFDQRDKEIKEPLLAFKCKRKDYKKYLKEIHQTLFKEVNPKKITYEKNSIYLFSSIDEKTYAVSHVNGVFLASSSLEEIKKGLTLIQDVNNSILEDKSFFSIRETVGKTVVANLYIHLTKISDFINSPIDDASLLLKKTLCNYTDWVGLDIGIDGETLLLDGYSLNNKGRYLAVFEEQDSFSLDFCDKLPITTYFFMHQSIADYSLYKESMLSQSLLDTTVLHNKKIDFITNHFDQEVILANVKTDSLKEDNSFLMLKLKNTHALFEFLENSTKKHLYSPLLSKQAITVYEHEKDLCFASYFGKYFKSSTVEYSVLLSDALLLSSSKELLVELADRIQAGQVISKNTNYTHFKEHFITYSSAFIYVDVPLYFKSTKKLAKGEDNLEINQIIRRQLKELGVLVYQLERERNFVYHSLLVKGGEPVKDVFTDSIYIAKTSKRIMWEIPFEKEIHLGPLAVLNQNTGRHEIFIQDKNNCIHLYSYDGKLLWQKNIDEPIMSEKIEQIDYYKNNKYQLLFNTKSKIYAIDRKGNYLVNYPKKLNHIPTAPLALFDYESNLDYRIFIPSKGRIDVFDKTTTQVKGWNATAQKTSMLSDIQYANIKGKDYLLAFDKERVYILDRRGNERVVLKKKIKPSVHNRFYLQLYPRLCLLVTDAVANLHQISFDGEVASFKNPETLSEHHQFIYTSVDRNPVYIFIDKSNVYVYNQRFKPVFNKNLNTTNLQALVDKNHLLVYSLDTKEAFLFNLRNLDFNEISFNSESLPFLGRLRPMPNEYLISQENNWLICYELNF